MSVTGEANRSGVRVGLSLIDEGTGVWAALSILAALRQRDATGSGATIDLSLYETAVSLMGYHLAGYAASGRLPGRHGTAFPSIAPYQAFAASDGELMIAAGNDRAFASLCSVVGVPGLGADPRYATNADRVANRETLIALLAPLIANGSRADWLERFAAANVPAAPVQDVRDVIEHPQTAALGLLQQLGGLPVAGLPLSVDGERVSHRSAAPLLGHDTEAVLREAGYAPETIRELGESGIIGGVS
jgi:crotonobetainyl-CoA:carnitine CoA-transferase CaiB-like acyl-CoA transferase